RPCPASRGPGSRSPAPRRAAPPAPPGRTWRCAHASRPAAGGRTRTARPWPGRHRRRGSVSHVSPERVAGAPRERGRAGRPQGPVPAAAEAAPRRRGVDGRTRPPRRAFRGQAGACARGTQSVAWARHPLRTRTASLYAWAGPHGRRGSTVLSVVIYLSDVTAGEQGLLESYELVLNALGAGDDG